MGRSLDGKDRGVPWSSAFISFVMSTAGNPFGVPFRNASAHNKYIREYIANRKEGRLNEAFVGYRIDEVSPKVGDLVVTSGSAQIFPSNILVGKIIEIRKDNFLVLPFVDFKNIDYVQVVENK